MILRLSIPLRWRLSTGMYAQYYYTMCFGGVLRHWTDTAVLPELSSAEAVHHYFKQLHGIASNTVQCHSSVSVLEYSALPV